MKYNTAAAFRQALEFHLREQSLAGGVPLTRLRKMVAFDRILARLMKQSPPLWVVKGGLALQLRLGEVARTTKDIDAALMKEMDGRQAAARLSRAASIDLGDWFEFEIGPPTSVATGAPRGGVRLPVRCLLDGRVFENFHIDIGIGDPLSQPPAKVKGPALLAFAGIPPSTISCYPLTAQIAEKFHAYTRPYKGGASSRVRDLADMLLIASMGPVDSGELTEGLAQTFDARATHKLPGRFPRPPATWRSPYRKLALESGLAWTSLLDAGRAASRFLDPILSGKAQGKWNPGDWSWGSSTQKRGG